MAASTRRIELIETLGKGGFGAVYLADVHGRDDFVQRLAVKVLSEEMHAHDDIAARQRDEARLLARLNHDHIVRVMDLTELGGRPAVLMEYVEGADAGELLRDGPVPVKAALQICAAAASALDAAWNSMGPRSGKPLRVIHRDIKPANLLVSRHGGVKVLDFGVARAEFDREGRTGSVQFGTARFMAPEQWLYGESSHAVDVYALGVSLVELVTGMHLRRPPLERGAFDAHVDAVRAELRDEAWSAGFALGMDALVQGMLAFTPDERPDARDCFDALTELADAAPGPSLRRWAPEVVPPLIEERRARWADEPVPDLAETGAHAVAVAVQQTATTGRPARPAEVNTLAVERPAAARRPWAGIAAGALVATAVVAIGLSVGLPLLAPAPVVVVEEEEPAEGAVRETAAHEAAAPEAAAPEAAASGAALDEAPGAAADGPPPPTSSAGTSPGSTPATAAPRGTSAEPPASSPPPSASPATASPAAARPAAAAPTPLPDPAPAAALETEPVTLSSTPWGARVAIDGAAVGTTPLRNLPLSVGEHEVHMVYGDTEIRRRITVGGRHPTTHTWNLESDQWRSSR